MKKLVIAMAPCLLALSAATGASAHGHGSKHSQNNHGSKVSAVARSKCKSANPHHTRVKNHGQCVKKTAHQ